MDPNAAWNGALVLIAAGKWAAAVTHLEDLKSWLEREGFPPRYLVSTIGVGRKGALSLVSNLLKMCETMADLEREEGDAI